MKNRILNRIGCGLLLLGGCVLLTHTAWTQQQFGTRRSSTTSGNYPSSTEIGQATITVDQETRKIIVVTDDDTAQYISQVVSNLDRPAPQVLIKVVFLEVTYRNGLDLGLSGDYAYTFGGGNAFTGSVSQAFGRGVGGGLYQVFGSDFSVTLHALAQAGKTEILSRPSILARNNQEAVITVGQQFPLVTSVRYDNYGNQISGISYQDIGIILRVTPFITSDGLVEMIVTPEISERSEEGVVISRNTETGESIEAPVINLRSADTVVVTPDGQTVVIGGLMAKTKRETETKIPVLGDIPLLGNLFKRKQRNDAKTELLIFLTPKIVTYPRELASITGQERANTQIIPKSFSEDELNQFLDSLPPTDTVDPKKKRKKTD